MQRLIVIGFSWIVLVVSLPGWCMEGNKFFQFDPSDFIVLKMIVELLEHRLEEISNATEELQNCSHVIIASCNPSQDLAEKITDRTTKAHRGVILVKNDIPFIKKLLEKGQLVSQQPDELTTTIPKKLRPQFSNALYEIAQKQESEGSQFATEIYKINSRDSDYPDPTSLEDDPRFLLAFKAKLSYEASLRNFETLKQLLLEIQKEDNNVNISKRLNEIGGNKLAIKANLAMIESTIKTQANK
jgi:hypothetical protein